MGSVVGGLLGLGGGSSPTAATLNTPTTSAQAGTQYQNTQQGLQQQQNFLKALQAQNGVQNQSQVYNQLQNVAAGQGPNPAQAQLAQATGANVANQAALMAGQRGAGANVGLLARQAAMQGANTQQQAAGQGATLQAQQSMNALGAMGSLANQQVAQQAAATGGYSQAAQNEQANVLNSINAQNAATVSNQSNVNNANANLAGIGMQGQQNLVGGLLNGAGAALGLAEGGEVGNSDQFSAVPVQGPGNIDIGSTPPPSSGSKSGSGMGGLGSMIGSLFADGGVVQVQGPSPINIGSTNIPTIKDTFGQPLSNLGKALGQNSIDRTLNKPKAANYSGDNTLTPQDTTMMAAKGGKVPALVSPGEQYLDKSDVKKVKEGKNPLSVGERIPGKPKHPGNDYRNDTVPKNLEAGGVVIPNEVMQSKNPPKEAHRFVAAVMAHHGKNTPRKKNG